MLFIAEMFRSLSRGRRKPACAAILVLLLGTVPLLLAQKAAHDGSYAGTVKRTYHYPFGSEPFQPSQAQTQTGTFIPASAFPPASYCASCHADVHAQWRQSAHANSFREPFYLRNVEMLNKSKGIESSRHCEGCHNPIALFSGALSTGSKIARPFDNDGVTCMVCHSIQRTQNTSGTGSYVMGIPAVMVKEDGTPIPGAAPFSEIMARPDLHRRAVMRDFYRTPEFCATCHKAAVPQSLNDYRWLRAFTVYDEWQGSSWSRQSLAPFYHKKSESTCQSCHMPAEAALHDYARKNSAVRSHRWLGANTAIPVYYGYREQLQKTQAFLKDAVTVDIFGITRNNGPLIAPVEHQNFNIAAGDVITAQVVLQNSRIGHSLVPEQRDFYQSWVEFDVRDAGGKEIYHSGALDQKGFLDPEAHTYTNRLVTAAGKLVDLHQVWDTRLKAYDNTIMPGRSDLARYRFQVPPGARSPITMTARLNYRRFRKQYTNFILADHPDYPVVEVASRKLSLQIGNNERTSGASWSPEYLRWNNYGIALLGQVQFARAAEAFRKVIELNPRYADGYTNIAIASYTELLDHKREGSDGLGTPGLSMGGTPDGTGNLFLAKASPESFEPALRALDMALKVDPGNLRARYHQGAIYRLQNKFTAAIETLKPVVDAYPGFREARQELGYSYYVTQQFGPAREQFEALQAINPDDITANYYLSYIYQQLGMKEKAAEQIKIFEARKEDVAAEPVAQEFWSRHENVAAELPPYHVHAAAEAPGKLGVASAGH
jgi:tetratricopeptide (TPR) repeat protein